MIVSGTIAISVNVCLKTGHNVGAKTSLIIADSKT